MVSLYYSQRLQDLQDHVVKDGDLLKDFEDALRVEDDPKRRKKYEGEIEQLRQSMVHYRLAYNWLKGQVTVDIQGNVLNLLLES
jgi:hypothetical protein